MMSGAVKTCLFLFLFNKLTRVMYEGHCKVTESNLAIGLALIDVDVELL